MDQMPPSQSHRLLPLGESRVETRDGQPWLIVFGEAPCANMEVALHPFYYVVQPDWWAIELVGSLPGGICLTSVKPYPVARPLRGITGHMGSSRSARTERYGSRSRKSEESWTSLNLLIRFSAPIRL